MRINFKGRPITKERLGWWLRIALTKIFGQRVFVEGRKEPLRILPWVYKGRLLVMGAEHEIINAKFSNQYTLRLCAASTAGLGVPLGSNHKREIKDIFHVVLCHQAPGVVDRIYHHHRALSPYNLIMAYGGPEHLFDRIQVPTKILVHDKSLRGPSYLMSHTEMVSAVMSFAGSRAEEAVYFFTESDLVPLRQDYLREAVDQMNEFGADFCGKEIRDVTNSNNFFLCNGMERNIVGQSAADPMLASKTFFHCLGCFFGIRGVLMDDFIADCHRMRGLYFEIMFPTAAAAVGGRLVSLDHVGEYLSHVRYRPVWSSEELRSAISQGIKLIHPVKDEVFEQALRLVAPRTALEGHSR